MSGLKPCPFCGGNAKISYCEMRLVCGIGYGNKKVRIGVKAICNRCKARGPLFTGNVIDPWTKEGKETEAYKFLVQQAEDTWNRRDYCFPTADVRPVVRGEWEHLNWGFDYDRCSICGYAHRWPGSFYFCPNCGAEMVTDCHQLEEDEG